jgi:putative flavoprotein involved in K+ transport
MKRTEAIIIGAGQAGLAVSRSLVTARIDHVLLERGRVAQRWTERWDSLRLLSPNWMTRLPGLNSAESDPDGFMSRDQVIDRLRGYARSFDAPVEEETTVLSVERVGELWRVETDRGIWAAPNVVVATGHCQKTRVPASARDLSPDIAQIRTSDYRNPEQLPPGGVLVVGASASGIQLANELLMAGRRVVLSVGRHTRLPRRYRGKDILYWLDRTGSFERPLSDMPDPAEAMREPSLQLVGNEQGASLDLAVLVSRGVELAGRLESFNGATARFARDLETSVKTADDQLKRLLARIDRHITTHGLNAPVPEGLARVPTETGLTDLDLRSAGITSVLWATGYSRSYEWLRAPVLDESGEILQVRGRTPAQGLYVIGLQFMIRRNSSFLHGVGRDAEEIAGEIRRRTQRREEAA